ncbi:unnamed protein product, partial [Ectocarpus sp. 12 AP-2014]
MVFSLQARSKTALAARSNGKTATNVECRQSYWPSIFQAGVNAITHRWLSFRHAVASPRNSYPPDIGRRPRPFTPCDPRGNGFCHCHRHFRSFLRNRGCSAVFHSPLRGFEAAADRHEAHPNIATYSSGCDSRSPFSVTRHTLHAVPHQAS